MALAVKIHLPGQEMKETRVRSLGREDPLEEEMAPCSCILAREILWTEEPGGLQCRGSQRLRKLDVTEGLKTHTQELQGYQIWGSRSPPILIKGAGSG